MPTILQWGGTVSHGLLSLKAKSSLDVGPIESPLLFYRALVTRDNRSATFTIIAMDIKRIVFVCQSGELEIKAALLAVSLREVLGTASQLIAAIPEPTALWGGLSALTYQLLAELGVDLLPIANPFGLRYPIANKIAALAALDNGPALLLDSDIVCLHAPSFVAHLENPDVSIKPADALSSSMDDEMWRTLYTRYELPLPERRVITTVTEMLSYPYFNSGVVYVKDARLFAHEWMAACKTVDADDKVSGKYPWLDQITLPLAISKLKWTAKMLGEQWNYPANVKVISPDKTKQPFFAHYHKPKIIARDACLASFVNGLFERHQLLNRLANSNESWNRHLGAPSKKGVLFRADGPDFLITGIPRSGTSLLCRLLDDQKNFVAMNEPRESLNNLESDKYGDAIAILHGVSRRNIQQGFGIENKIIDGRVITDTALLDRRERYYPPIFPGNICLGTKNTLAYLTRLPLLHRSFPRSPILTCIRNPHATIASWKQSFEHLAYADVSRMMKTNLIGIHGYTWQLQRLYKIADTSDIRLRRALFWRHLAMLVVEHREWLLVVALEELVRQPGAVISSVVMKMDPGREAEQTIISVEIQESRATTKGDAVEEQIIADICGPVAEEFGYSM